MSICRIDGCDVVGIHDRHAVEAWCQVSACAFAKRKGRAPALTEPTPHGELVCSCGSPMCAVGEDLASTWRDVTKRCYARLMMLRKLNPDTSLLCSWCALGDCQRCAGTGYRTVRSLIAHYDGMLNQFEADETRRHPLEISIENAMSAHEPKRFAAVLADVTDDYGSVGPNPESAARVLHRYLARLAERGRILRIDLGAQLYAYMKRGSRAANDLAYLRDTIMDDASAQLY